MENYTFTHKANNGVVANMTIPHNILIKWMVFNGLLASADEPVNAETVEQIMDAQRVRWLVADLPELIY